MGIYTTLLYRPILNVFIALYNIIPEAGVVIILLTLAMRLLLYPFYKKQVEAQKSMQDLQPKLNAIKSQYKDDKEGQAKAMMELYKSNKVNPLSSCLPVLIQLPIFLAVYQVLRKGLSNTENFDLLYSFVAKPETIHTMFLGTIDLAGRSIVLAVLAGLAQFWQAKMLVKTKAKPPVDGSKDEDTMAMMNKQMMYFMPVMIVFFGLSLPSGLSLYWLVSTLFMIAQQYIAFRDTGSTVIDDKVEVIKAN